MNRITAIVALLLVALAVGTYFLLNNRPAETGDTSVMAGEPVDEEGLPERISAKKGALTYFDLAYGELGYVDVTSLTRDRDPHSVIALLQNHHEFTGAGGWLELEVGATKENEVWGYRTRFTQLIDGKPTQWGGTILFSSSGAVGMVHGDLVNSQALISNSAVYLRPEAEAIAYEAAVNYAANLPDSPYASELHGQPPQIDVRSVPHFEGIRYELAHDNELHRVWQVGVSISGSKNDSVEVVVSAETGEVVRIGSARMRQTATLGQQTTDPPQPRR